MSSAFPSPKADHRVGKGDVGGIFSDRPDPRADIGVLEIVPAYVFGRLEVSVGNEVVPFGRRDRGFRDGGSRLYFRVQRSSAPGEAYASDRGSGLCFNEQSRIRDRGIRGALVFRIRDAESGIGIQRRRVRPIRGVVGEGRFRSVDFHGEGPSSAVRSHFAVRLECVGIGSARRIDPVRAVPGTSLVGIPGRRRYVCLAGTRVRSVCPPPAGRVVSGNAGSGGSPSSFGRLRLRSCRNPVHEGCVRVFRRIRGNESDDGSRGDFRSRRYGKISHDGRDAGGWGDRGDLYPRSGTFLSAGRRGGHVERPDRNLRRIRRRHGGEYEAGSSGYPEFFGVEFQTREVRISGRVVRIERDFSNVAPG